MSTEFKKLKTALLVISSNYSTVLNEIKKDYDIFYTNSLRTPDHEFDVLIHNDYLPAVQITKSSINYVIRYDSTEYYFNEFYITKSTRYEKSITVDIRDIDNKTDMFSLSTVRDFYDLEFHDIEVLLHFIDVCRSIMKGTKHV